jgi:LPS O-antigen subunit length determinant protein (WzzB/FepE family)
MTIAAWVILSAIIGGVSGACVVVLYDMSERKRTLEEFKHKHDLN